MRNIIAQLKNLKVKNTLSEYLYDNLRKTQDKYKGKYAMPIQSYINKRIKVFFYKIKDT